jgi:tyrosyl-tRNA synthetase
MLTFDSVRIRLDREQPLTFLEFNYMILQAYDFLELSRRVGCRAQMGGSDQWGNIVNGIELARRTDGAELFGVTTPLITTADGSKMGKTAQGAVWLDEKLLSSYDYWQFWRNTQDDDVGRFLRLFTDLPLDEIAMLERLRGAEINQAKMVLATEATTLLHGRDAALAAEHTARQTFEDGGVGEDLPKFRIPEDGAGIIEALMGLGFAASRKEAIRKISEGAVRLNDQKIHELSLHLLPTNAGDRLSLGKKRHGLLIN